MVQEQLFAGRTVGLPAEHDIAVPDVHIAQGLALVFGEVHVADHAAHFLDVPAQIVHGGPDGRPRLAGARASCERFRGIRGVIDEPKDLRRREVETQIAGGQGGVQILERNLEGIGAPREGFPAKCHAREETGEKKDGGGEPGEMHPVVCAWKRKVRSSRKM